jgi:hypothetical protein
MVGSTFCATCARLTDTPAAVQNVMKVPDMAPTAMPEPWGGGGWGEGEGGEVKEG